MNNLEEAHKDFVGYIEDIIAKRELTKEEKAAIKIKLQYWHKIENLSYKEQTFAEKFFHL